MKARRISVEEALGIVEGGMQHRVVTDEVLDAWRVLRSAIHRSLTPAEFLHRRPATSAARTGDPRAVHEADDDDPTRPIKRLP